MKGEVENGRGKRNMERNEDSERGKAKWKRKVEWEMRSGKGK